MCYPRPGKQRFCTFRALSSCQQLNPPSGDNVYQSLAVARSRKAARKFARNWWKFRRESFATGVADEISRSLAGLYFTLLAPKILYFVHYDRVSSLGTSHWYARFVRFRRAATIYSYLFSRLSVARN